MMTGKEGEIRINNLPNMISREHILEYLATAGPIQRCEFKEEGQKLSADVTYFDMESALTAKKFLDQKEFNTRKIKITILNEGKDSRVEPHHPLRARLAALKKDERTKLLRYLRQLRDEEGQMFIDFIDDNRWLADELLRF